MSGSVVVLDAGKTNAKLTLWRDGQMLAREVRANPASRDCLDVVGIEAWLEVTLRRFAQRERISEIVPVGHGAAAALVSQGSLYTLPADYEADSDPAERAAYELERDAFANTGSPSLPAGLNLGFQLFQASRETQWPKDLRILLWPQFWAWRLCGVMATEVTSLGCHTDLWSPRDGQPSELAMRWGWSERLPPIRHAGDVLDTVSVKWQRRCGLPADCRVLCGLHDSNAALLAARGHSDIATEDATVLSTGTWFVAMRSPAVGATADLAGLVEGRDCLVNVDIGGRPVPSARFMGGREAEIMGGIDSHDLTTGYDPAKLLGRLSGVLEAQVMALPSFVRGVGPFPEGLGHWRRAPADETDRRAATGLYLALMADTLLEFTRSRGRLLIEGRFAEAQVFVRAVAALRPEMQVYVSNAHNDVPYGALRLIDPTLSPLTPLVPVEPLALDLQDYAASWRDLVASPEAVA